MTPSKRKHGVLILAVLGGAIGIGASLAAVVLVPKQSSRMPELASVVTQVREVARLETLDVTLYKKITFTAEPDANSGALWKDVLAWARYTLRTPRGKALVFAEAHLGVDFSKLTDERIWIDGSSVYVSLPPVRAVVELKPGETEIIDSNLDSIQTARLFELAKDAFTREVEADTKLQTRARASAERAVRLLLLETGFTQVYFVDHAPGPS